MPWEAWANITSKYMPWAIYLSPFSSLSMQQSISDICPLSSWGWCDVPFENGHEKHFVKSCSNMADVQLSSFSLGLLYAALGTQKTHSWAICRSVKCACSESIAIWLEDSTSHLLRLLQAEALGLSSPSS